MTITVRLLTDNGPRRLFRSGTDTTWSMLWRKTSLPEGEHELALESQIAARLPDEKTIIGIKSFVAGEGGISNNIRLKKGKKHPLASHGVEFEGE